ncbi:DUF305 domain-containing protein [Streptomyces milbemycinicus]|uniref:DUF305 domain-containing protein n=1 Tax=Streptomyces milbemycinicus TaxID=476552 RepID=UPI0033D9CAE8
MRHGRPSGMPGMMCEQQMHAMERTSGKAFDTTFLTMMIEHHEGAVQMARTEKSKVSTAPPRHSPTASRIGVEGSSSRRPSGPARQSA